MIKIDGKDFDEKQLSAKAKQQIANLQFVDMEIARLNSLLALCQAARATYAWTLKEEVGMTSASTSTLLEKNGTIQFT